MADTTKIYENIFIKKNAAGDREYIKVPYAILADPPTIPDVSGFMPKSGGTFTGDVTFNKKINLGQGDANCLYLGSDGRLNGPENRTLFGLVSGATTFGHQAYSLHFRGSAARPQYTTDGSNYKDLALKSDIPAAVTESTVSGWGFTKNKGTVTSVAVKMNGVSKGTVTSSGTIDLGTVLTDASKFATAAQGTKADNAVPNTRKVNNKALSSDITLGAADVGVTETAFPGLKKTGTVTGVKMNGTTKNPSSGVVDIGTVITDVSGKQDKITSSNKLAASLVSGLSAVATSGSYNDLSNKPTIPTVNNGTLTIKKNGTNVATFSANQSGNATANITVPTFSLSGTTLTITV